MHISTMLVFWPFVSLVRNKESGYSKIYLWVLEENHRAREFYEAMGFRANGDSITQNIGGKNCIEIRYKFSLAGEVAPFVVSSPFHGLRVVSCKLT